MRLSKELLEELRAKVEIRLGLLPNISAVSKDIKIACVDSIIKLVVEILAKGNY